MKEEIVGPVADEEKPRGEAKALSVEIGEDGEVDEQGIETPANEAEGGCNDAYSDECSGEKEQWLIVMVGAQNLIGRESGVEQAHWVKWYRIGGQD